MTPELQLDAMAGFAAPLGSAFRCVVADPPWKLEMGDSRTMNGEVKRGKWNDPVQNNVDIAELKYPTMTVDEICALQIPAADRQGDKPRRNLISPGNTILPISEPGA